MDITYTEIKGIYYPNLAVITTNYHIGKWGKLHKRWLKDNHKSIYTSKLMSGNLDTYLKDIDNQAQNMYDTLVKQLAEREGVTEQLKASDMMAWVQAINNIENQVREIICNDIIYCIN